MKKVKKVVKRKVEKKVDRTIEDEILGHVKAKGDGLFAITELASNPKFKDQIKAVVETGRVSHGKFAALVKETANTLGLDIEIKTIFVLKKRS